MSHPPLEALVAQIRSLPGGGAERGLPRAAAAAGAGDEAPLTPAALRARAAALVAALAERVEAALPTALERATQAWDQADDFVILDGELGGEAAALRRAADALAQDDGAAARAAGIESRLLIDAAFGLVGLLERRFAAVVRLRLRSATPELIVDGRPFLDVAPALAEVARRWR